MKVKKNKEHFNDLLMPVLLVLCVMPFIIRYAEYDYGYGKYAWHSDDSVMQDFYTYYRCMFFIFIITAAAIIIGLRCMLYKNKIKPSKIFIPLMVYTVSALLSTVFSVNPAASWKGNFVSYEGIFVLAGYVLMCFYAYQILETENDCRIILRWVQVMFILMSIVGWLQVFQHDLLNYQWVQKLVMSKEYFAEYGGMVDDVFTGNNVFLTLYNPNYAAIFLVMFAGLFTSLLFHADGKREKIKYAFYTADAVILCWFTYTRAALVALAVMIVVFVICFGKQGNKRKISYFIPAALLLTGMLFLVDYVTGGKYINRMLDDKKESSIESVLTKEDGVEIQYHGGKYVLSFEDVKDGEIKLPFSDNSYASAVEWDGKRLLLVLIDDYTLQFVQENGKYYYYTEWDKTDEMKPIKHVDFHGLEYLGSGRLYIWSRVIPMLKNYLFVGSGPDTFAEVYPQDDYIGKMIYSESTARIAERAHNDYMMKWVQTGFISVVALAVFYILYVKMCFSYYRKCRMDTEFNKFGFGCFLGTLGYMVCSFFSDSTLYTTPVFWVFAGVALAVVHIGGQEDETNEYKK